MAERKDRNLFKIARAVSFQTKLPKHFWEETILTTTYLIKRLTTRIFNFKNQ